MIQDYQLIEKLAHQNRERTVHAKGSGAFGTFTVTQDITKYTKAAIFSQVGKNTDALLRFSTVAGERGAADAERNVRGFALKFYTEEGNYPLIDVGVLELNRNPENCFAEIEQSAFSPSNIVAGISFSPDKMLQARIFFLRRFAPLPRRYVVRKVAGQCAEIAREYLSSGWLDDAGRAEGDRCVL